MYGLAEETHIFHLYQKNLPNSQHKRGLANGQKKKKTMSIFLSSSVTKVVRSTMNLRKFGGSTQGTSSSFLAPTGECEMFIHQRHGMQKCEVESSPDHQHP
ncbi:hypothetical protein CEXT_182591 [Caerostris extrusa]|uniref:Uncharacterized protein n=1 Tax=Caerostris extrusa TaxID=172846 RepID=A0AAV4NH54_CAEEX|nr:hypothetical protein CEXT_182591 [Caerostris extrusa]